MAGQLLVQVFFCLICRIDSPPEEGTVWCGGGQAQGAALDAGVGIAALSTGFILF